jgi:hypothetical protein
MRNKSTNPLVVGGVIGDVLDPFTNSVSLRVIYENNKEVINSGELKPSQIVNLPRVQVGGNDFRTLYTLVRIHMYSLISQLHLHFFQMIKRLPSYSQLHLQYF